MFFPIMLTCGFLLMFACIVMFLIVSISLTIYYKVSSIIATWDSIPMPNGKEKSVVCSSRLLREHSPTGAFKIYVTFEPRYLAFANFVTTKINSTTTASTRSVTMYFDRLSEIPIIAKCPSEQQMELEKRYSLTNVIDTLGQNSRNKRERETEQSSSR